MSDDALLSLVDRLDRSVASVADRGFLITPFDRDDRASDTLGLDVWGKDETGNVGGSHKARHLFGLLAHLEIQRASARTRLAIASCGNAALAATLLARARRRPIEVFVPETANQMMIERLGTLGASVTTCAREDRTTAGDPCIHRFRVARDGGAFAFCCQGSEQGLTIDGGATLGYELATQLSLIAMSDVPVCVPVGGGALGTSVAAGLNVARRLGILDGAPRLHFVQAEGCAPLHRAWRRVAERALAASGVSSDDAADASDFEAATLLVDPERSDAVRGALGWAATHRSHHMWAWDEPSSMATGILDDETYDWFALVRAMLETGGWPLVVTERQLERANDASSVAADHTGSAALAGAIALGAPSGAKVVVVYSGIRR